MRRFGGVVLLAVALALAAWWSSQRSEETLALWERHPEGVMGTTCRLEVAMPARDGRRAEALLDSAEAELRRLEATLSTWIDGSELSSLNALGAGGEVVVSKPTADVLAAALRMHRETAGAFDVTAGAVFELWRDADGADQPPSAEAIREAREASSWSDFELEQNRLLKLRGTGRFDVAGVAKGYAVDRALARLQSEGAVGGLVEIGGDLRVFGRAGDAGYWRVGVQSPFEERLFGAVELSDGAVCTSGDYRRFVTIGGRRYSHIVDPRTGLPVEGVPSVTVIAADAVTADAWATALSVDGVHGLTHLAPGVEALLVVGAADAPRLVASDGLMDHRVTVEGEVEVVERAGEAE